MKNPALFLLLFLLFAIINCEEGNEADTPNDVNFENFKSGLLSYNDELIEKEFAKIADAFPPSSTASDDIGHQENLRSVIELIGSDEGLEASLICYACIETFPPQSEIIVSLDSLGHTVKRVLDILTPSDTLLVFRTVHEYYEPDLTLNKTVYGGCFYDEKEAESQNRLSAPDSISYIVAYDTLNLNVHMKYNCCGSLIDSTVIGGDIVNIYIADVCKESCVCRCMCEFDFHYMFTDFWQKKIHFYVYLKPWKGAEYNLWGETKFIDSPD